MKINRTEQIDKALDIAAEMFAVEGYVTPTGNGSATAIRRWLLGKATAEIKAEAEKENL